MNKILLFLFVITIVGAYFFWGINQSNKATKADCEKEIVIKEKEVIKYVTSKKSDIYAVPNSSRSELLKLMSENKL